MRRVFLVVCLLLAPVGASAKDHGKSCAGVDLLQQMRAADPRAFAAYEAEAARVPNVDGLLWRIEKPDTPPSYLFGTMHVGNADTLALAGATAEQVRRSRVVLTEVGDLDARKRRQAGAAVIAKGVRREGGALAIVRDRGDQVELRKLLVVQKLDYRIVDHLAPWVTLMLVAMPICERARAQIGVRTVDDAIVEMAHAAKAPVVAIETVEEQIDALAGLKEDLVARSLVWTARHPRSIDDGFVTLLRLYREKRVGAVLAMTQSFFRLSAQAREDYEAATKALAGNRNVIMAERIQPELARGGAFVAVGALHLPGEDGLVALLRKAGYEVRKEW